MLFRQRRQVLSLDSSLLLTRGNPLGWSSIIDYLHPERGIYTGVCDCRSGLTPLVGQLHGVIGERTARLTYVIPADALDSPELVDLLESLVRKAGEWGVFSLAAEVEEQSPAFEALRRAGFKVYARQQVYQCRLSALLHEVPAVNNWKVAGGDHQISLRSLYQALVPPLVQAVEPLPVGSGHGLVYCQDGDVKAFTGAKFGPQGVYLTPLIHPELTSIPQLLSPLITRLEPLLGRPVYLAVRAYQGWPETQMGDILEPCLPPQVLMVRHLGLLQRVVATNGRREVLETSSAQPTTTVLNQAATRSDEPLGC